MVVRTRHDELTPDEVDRIFHALADATRRDVVVRVLQDEHSVSDLAGHYPMSFAAVQKHVAVLERAGLVVKRRHGREQLVSGNIATVQRAAELLDQLELLWRARLERFGDVLAGEGSGDVLAGNDSGDVLAGEGSGDVLAGGDSGDVLAGEDSGDVLAGNDSGEVLAVTSRGSDEPPTEET